MKNAWITGALALLMMLGFAACGSDEEPQPAAEAMPEEQAAIEEDAALSEEAAADEQEAQVVVEESAAEPESDEQPIMLARADSTNSPVQNWKFKEGQHYIRMVPSQPTMGGADKIEVAEFFWYGCPHCYSFEPTINAWAEEIPANARFVRIPVTWREDLHKVHARIYFTMEVLARNGALADGETFHNTVFEEIQNRDNRLTSEASIRRLFERFGVDAETFDKAWKSFEVDQKLRIATDLGRRYNIQGVPAVVVNGKYRTGGVEAGSYDAVPDVIDELIARESQR